MKSVWGHYLSVAESLCIGFYFSPTLSRTWFLCTIFARDGWMNREITSEQSWWCGERLLHTGKVMAEELDQRRDNYTNWCILLFNWILSKVWHKVSSRSLSKSITTIRYILGCDEKLCSLSLLLFSLHRHSALVQTRKIIQLQRLVSLIVKFKKAMFQK